MHKIILLQCGNKEQGVSSSYHSQNLPTPTSISRHHWYCAFLQWLEGFLLMVALLLAETLLVFVFFFPTCSALLCLSGCALYHSQHPTHPCASADHFTKFSVIGIGLVDLFSPTGLDDFFVVFLSELLSITFSLFISVSYHIFHETLPVSSVSAPKNGWCRNISSAGSWWCWNRVPKSVSALF